MVWRISDNVSKKRDATTVDVRNIETHDLHEQFLGAPNLKVDFKRKDFRKTPGRPPSTQTSTLKFVDRAQKCFDISYVTSTRFRALWSRHDIVVPGIPKMTPDDSAGQAARSRREVKTQGDMEWSLNARSRRKVMTQPQVEKQA